MQGSAGQAGTPGVTDVSGAREGLKVRWLWKPHLSAEGHCRPLAGWMHSYSVVFSVL